MVELDRQVGRLLDALRDQRSGPADDRALPLRQRPAADVRAGADRRPPGEQAQPLRGRDPAPVHRLGARPRPGRGDERGDRARRRGPVSQPLPTSAGPRSRRATSPTAKTWARPSSGNPPGGPGRSSGSTAATTGPSTIPAGTTGPRTWPCSTGTGSSWSTPTAAARSCTTSPPTRRKRGTASPTSRSWHVGCSTPS